MTHMFFILLSLFFLFVVGLVVFMSLLFLICKSLRVSGRSCRFSTNSCRLCLATLNFVAVLVEWSLPLVAAGAIGLAPVVPGLATIGLVTSIFASSC